MVTPPRPGTTGGTALAPVHESWLPNEHSLYRPRHSTRQRTALVCALAFFLAPAIAFGLGVRPVAFENKALQDFPTPADGWEMFTKLPVWGTDHLPLRQAGISAADWIGMHVFGDEPRHDQGAPGAVPGLGPSPSANDKVPASGFPNLIQGTNGWLYLGLDASNKCQPVMSLDQIANAIRRLREAVENSGRRFELVVAPDKSTAAPDHLPSTYAGKECSRQRSEQFWLRATKEFGVIDLRGELRTVAARQGRSLYDPNDSHWTYDGGIVMAYALADRIKPGVTKSWLVKPRGYTRWPADLPLLLGQYEQQRQLRDYTLAPDGKTDMVNYQPSDFRVPFRLIQPRRDRPVANTVSERVGLIADSFTQFASPFLAAGFQDLVIVHPETVAANAADNARKLLVDRDVVVVELAERNVAGGLSPLLQDATISQISDVLAQNRR